MRGIDDMFGLAWCTLRHGYLYLRSGDLDAAREKLRVSLEGARYLGHTTFVLGALAGCAALASFDGQDQAAIRLAARSAPLLDTPPGVGGPTNSAARISCRPALDALRARVPREVLLAETAMGESMSIEEAITLGRRVVQASVAV
jgi:hypothetical protein